MRGRAEQSELPGAELQERRRDGRVVTLPGVPGYLIHASVTTPGPPAGARVPLRRRWELMPARTRRIVMAVVWLLVIVALAIAAAALGGGTESGGAGG